MPPKKNNESRVSNPFGAVPSQSSFGAFGGQAPSTSAFGAFGSQPTQPSPFGTFGTTQQQSFGTFGAPAKPFGAFSAVPQQTTFQQPQRIGKGATSATMDDAFGSSPSARVSNPFGGAAKNMTRDEAVLMYKNECLKLKGYPFSCLGPPDVPPPLTGDISPEELRWYLSQASPEIQAKIADRSALLGVDLTNFVSAGLPRGLTIQRTGPYQIPDAGFPSFVPRAVFALTKMSTQNISDADRAIFTAREIGPGTKIPLLPPPLELR